MLGPVQMAWLEEQLKNSKGTFRVICSSVPWDFRTKGSSLDTCNGFRDERAEIFSWIDEFQLDGVVLMSADRHRSDAWRIERPGAYDLYEFNSSRLTNQHSHGTMAAAVFSYNEKQSFGLVSFDTTAADPTVKYEVITIDGEPVHEIELRHSQLRHK
jgi:alkaline phosphatase D